MNVENILKMEQFMKSVPDKNFDIGLFRTDDNSKPECNSIGCWLGHCTALDPVTVMERFYSKDTGIMYDTWGAHYMGVAKYSNVSQFITSPFWDVIDNTVEGARKRAIWITENEGLLNEYLYNEHMYGVSDFNDILMESVKTTEPNPEARAALEEIMALYNAVELT